MRFRAALAAEGFGAIAEFKRRSPSAGDIRPDADVSRIARAYEQAGARAMSVLVDERFGGTWDDLRAARAATTLPLLAKGFFSTPNDLRDREGRVPTPRCCSCAISTTNSCAPSPASAASLGLDTLVEAHDADELARATRSARR